MRKTLNRVLALFLVAVLLLPLFPFQPVQAASTNVIQSRTTADISDFPASYQIGLTRIKELYPNAKFIYYDTGLDWYDDLLQPENELLYGRNLISSKSPTSWLSSDEQSYDPVTGKYNEVEPGWVQASQQVIEYYMDPRNFFNEKDIFQFVSLSFDSAQTVEGTQAVLGSGSFMSKGTIQDLNGNEISYAQAFYEIGKEYGVSPYLLACRARQEQGNGSALIYGTYAGYEGYYNYFNIGAYGPTTKAIITNGLSYAKSHGWDTPYKSIQGGAAMLKSSYVDSGKNCLYLHHFNVVANSSHKVSYAPYMGAIQAPYYETKSLSASYTNKNAAYTFIIPVYSNMPETPCDLPEGDGNGSYFLKNLTVNDGEIAFGKFSPYTYNYTATTNSDDGFVMIKAQLFSKTSTIAINGASVELEGDVLEKGVMLSPGFNDIVLTVTAENGMCRDYVISIINDDGNPHYKSAEIDLTANPIIIKQETTVDSIQSKIKTINCTIMIIGEDDVVKANAQNCVTGDRLIMLDKDNKVVFNSTLFIYGDVDKNGLITGEDEALIVQHMLEQTTLTLEQQDIADIDGDGVISIRDLGLLKMKRHDVEMEPYTENVELTLAIPETTVINKRSALTLTSTPGTYFVEGFVVYNEGAVKTTSTEYNSGKIHFIADGSKIIFDNAVSEQIFNTLILSQSVEFGFEIVGAFDYIANKDIEVKAESKATVVKNTELAAAIEFKGQPVAGTTNQYNALKLTLTNQSSMSMGIVDVEYGQFLVNKKGEHSETLKGILRWASTDVEVYTADNLVAGTYQTAIKVRYQSYDGTESLMSIPVTFTVEEHDHSNAWTVKETTHSINCKVCKVSIDEEHVYHKETANKYVCIDCAHTLDYTVTLTTENPVINKATVVKSDVKLNGKSVKADNYTMKWYVNGSYVSDTKEFAYIFKSVGTHSVDCVITLDNGKTIVGTTIVNIANSGSNAIRINTIGCSNITITTLFGYEYKINNGKWQSSGEFDGLQVGQEYTVYQRNKKTKSVTSVRVYVSHNVDFVEGDISCQSDVTFVGNCTHCKKQVSKVFANTKTECVFSDYKRISEASCQSGSVEEAKCKYGCGASVKRTLDDGTVHKFVKYTSDNNATCVSAGTETAYCSYGCGTADIRPIVAERAGHNYEYKSDNNATIEHSMTETGICVTCGQQNTRLVYGTRLQYIRDINLTMSSAVTNRIGLPEVLTTNENITINKVIWANSGGVTFEGTADNLIVKSGETYKLQTLTLTVKEGYAPYEYMTIYINGNKYTGKFGIDGKTITLTDVGQFSF